MKACWQNIAHGIDFSSAVEEACNIIHEGAGCEHCPNEGVGCFTECNIAEAHYVSAEKWQEFFDFANDVESGLDFESWCTPDRSDMER